MTLDRTADVQRYEVISGGYDDALFAAADLTPADRVLDDAQTHPFPDGAFDLVLSRFGTMFFTDPVAAFTNLRRATAPGGRLVQARIDLGR